MKNKPVRRWLGLLGLILLGHLTPASATIPSSSQLPSGSETRYRASSLLDTPTLRAEARLTPEIALGWEPSPIWTDGGETLLHRYLYAQGNPLRYVDPDGHEASDEERLAGKRQAVAARAGKHPAIARRLTALREGEERLLLGRMNDAQLDALLDAPLDTLLVSGRKAAVVKEAGPTLVDRALEFADKRYGGILRGAAKLKEASEIVDAEIKNKPGFIEYESASPRHYEEKTADAVKQARAKAGEGVGELGEGTFNLASDYTLAQTGVLVSREAGGALGERALRRLRDREFAELFEEAGQLGVRTERAQVAEALDQGASITGKVGAGVTRQPRHHVFPQQHRDWFEARGVDIDRYTLPLQQGEHTAVHTTKWNPRIMSRLMERESDKGSQLTRREILKIGAEVRREFNLSHVKAVSYTSP